MSRRVVVIMSGGLDSTTLLYHHAEIDTIRALGFDYGQRHRRELDHAQVICQGLGVLFTRVDLSGLRDVLPGSSQTDDRVAVPEGRYDEESMKATVVPNRNMIMLSIAIGHAIAHGMGFVSYGAHAGDHAIYPDCRPIFAKRMSAVAAVCDWNKVRLLRPFMKDTKADIVMKARLLKVPVAATYSCYKGEELHCGRCGTCIERREAFYLAGVLDPTVYQPDAPSVEQMVAHNWKLPS